ncbi:NACHT domain-containing protein [Streptomyces sp. NPDC021056]|uniref:NACHT domain-containing protein n=1 Tax=Streptomyces sp. NPDC021056 TaxID=3155012 RepID=UPI0033D60503
MREQLRRLQALAGSPTADNLREHADRRNHSVSRSALAAVTGNSGGGFRWATVEAFIDACASYAKARGRPLPSCEVDMLIWRARFDEVYRVQHKGRTARAPRQVSELPAPALQTEDDYLQACIEEFAYLDSPVLDLFSSVRVPLLDAFVSLQAVSVDPRASADILIREELERAIRDAGAGHAHDASIPGRVVVDRLKKTWGDVQQQSPLAPIEEILPRAPAVVILGHPGSGKSTLLRQVALVAAKSVARGDRSARCPFLFRLPELDAHGNFAQDLGGALSDVLSARYGTAAADSFGARIDAGQAVLLLDGLDEVGDVAARTRAVAVMQRYAQRILGNGNRVVVTSRIVGYRTHRPLGYPFEHYSVAELAPPTANRLLASLLGKLYRAEGSVATEAPTDEAVQVSIATISASPGAESLLTRPLTATMLAATFTSTRSVPTTRCGLFQRVTSLMEREWADLTGRPLPFPESIVSCALAGVGGWLIRYRPSGLLSTHEVTKVVAEALIRGRLATAEVARRTAGELLDHIRGGNGILVEKSPGLVGFSQRVFLEYYAAVHAVRESADVRRTVVEYSSNSAYAELVPLIVGISDQHHPGSGEDLVVTLATDGERATPLHRSLLVALRSLPELPNPGTDLAHRVAEVLSRILFQHQRIADDRGHVEYRPTMFRSFRRELHEALASLARSPQAPDIVGRLTLRYRSWPNDTDQDYTWVVNNDEDDDEDFHSGHSMSTVRTLNFLEFLGALGWSGDHAMQTVDAVLANPLDSLRKAAVRCLYDVARISQAPEATDRLRKIVANESAEYDYQDFQCEAITLLCRLDRRDERFLNRLEFFLRERHTFESYATVAGLPYMTYDESVGRLYQLALDSPNAAVAHHLLIEIAASGVANRVEPVQDILVKVIDPARSQETMRYALEALALLEWLSGATRQALLDIALEGSHAAWVRTRAAFCLRHSPVGNLMDQARAALRETDPVLSYAGLCLLAGTGVLPNDCMSLIIDIATCHPDEMLRSDAYDLLAAHGYASAELTHSAVLAGLGVGWDSRLRYNAIQIASRKALPTATEEHLSGLVEACARDPQRDDPPARAEFTRRNSGHIFSDDETEVAYNAALILAFGGRWIPPVAAVITAAVNHPSNSVRQLVYQDLGLGTAVPNLVVLLLGALAQESEFLSGLPSLYGSLDRIAPLDEASIEAVLKLARSTDDIDVLAFCCQLVGDSVSARTTPLPDGLMQRCFRLATRALCGPAFDLSKGEDVGGPKMRDRMFDALGAIADAGWEWFEQLNSRVAYPWRPDYPQADTP